MIISLRQLQQYIDISESIDELSNILTFSGIEVEAIRNLNVLPDTIITVRIEKVAPLPGSDHLHLCNVNAGNNTMLSEILDSDGLLQIVCGAPNCKAGMIAVLALPGTTLGDMIIKSTKLRGFVSHGMLCSEKELGLSDNHAGIVELPPTTEIGISPNSLFGLPDTLFELEITPNRSDLLGYIGIARDLSASLNREIVLPQNSLKIDKLTDSTIEINIQDKQKCPRYTGRVISGVNVEDSPLWLKVFLIKHGLRPINNIVDVTNYVMLVTGHPLHAFDLDKVGDVNDRKIIVRAALANEQLLALDGKSYSLTTNDLVIANAHKPLAIAGVIGGEESGISSQTTDLILESATFYSSAVRKTSYDLKVSTDSSYRFERQLSVESPVYASELATSIIMEICEDCSSGELIDTGVNISNSFILGIRPDRFKKVIGYELSDIEIRNYLERLGFRFISIGGWCEGVIDSVESIPLLISDTDVKYITHYFHVPHYRIDIEREIDIIEELARLASYSRIPHNVVQKPIMDRHSYKIRRKIEDYFVQCGFYEVLNFSFDDPELINKLGLLNDEHRKNSINLVNPQSSSMAIMRTMLLPGLLNNLLYNVNRGERNCKLFEISKTYKKEANNVRETYDLTAVLTGTSRPENWKTKSVILNAWDIKGIIDTMLEILGINNYVTYANRSIEDTIISGLRYSHDNIQIVKFGILRPDLAEKFGFDPISLDQDIWILDFNLEKIIELAKGTSLQFEPIPRYPSVNRDLSFLLRNEYQYGELLNEIRNIETTLIENIEVFDEYKSKQLPDGYRSISIHVSLCDKQKTLTEERIDELVAQIQKHLQEKMQIIMR